MSWFGFAFVLLLLWVWMGFSRRSLSKRPKDHINIRIWHSGSKAQYTYIYRGDTRNHGLWDPYVYVVFWAPLLESTRSIAVVVVVSTRYNTGSGLVKVKAESPYVSSTAFEHYGPNFLIEIHICVYIHVYIHVYLHIYIYM